MIGHCLDEVRRDQFDEEAWDDVGKQDCRLRHIRSNEVEGSCENDNIEHIVDEAFDRSVRCEHQCEDNIPKSQNAVQTLGSAPANACLRRERKMAHVEEGEPGNGIAMQSIDFGFGRGYKFSI